MKINKIKVTEMFPFVLFCMMLILVTCSDDVDFGEQYKKTVYIVNSNDLLHIGEHSFETDNDAIVISVYCASSKPITEDLTVRLKVDRHPLDSMNTSEILADPNYTDRIMLPNNNYQVDGEQYLTIKAGEQYGLLEVPFDFSGLDPSIPYALPLTLVSNNADYEINPKLKSIVYQIEMVNKYAGNYNGSSQTSPTSILGIQPKLKALSINEVRMPIHNLSGDEEDLLTNFMVLKIASDNSVSISPWGIADVTDLGGSTYDPVRHSFELHYQFIDAAANLYNVTSRIRDINAPPLEEDEL